MAMDKTGMPRLTLAQTLSSKAEVDRVLAQARAAGATDVFPAIDRDWGGYSGYFSDLDGFLWEIAWNPYFSI